MDHRNKQFWQNPEQSSFVLFDKSKRNVTLITHKIAGIAQLVERCLAKAKVAGPNPVSRSTFSS